MLHCPAGNGFVISGRKKEEKKILLCGKWKLKQQLIVSHCLGGEKKKIKFPLFVGKWKIKQKQKPFPIVGNWRQNKLPFCGNFHISLRANNGKYIFFLNFPIRSSGILLISLPVSRGKWDSHWSLFCWYSDKFISRYCLWWEISFMVGKKTIVIEPFYHWLTCESFGSKPSTSLPGEHSLLENSQLN